MMLPSQLKVSSRFVRARAGMVLAKAVAMPAARQRVVVMKRIARVEVLFVGEDEVLADPRI